MICPNCGEKIPDNTVVCPLCSFSVKKQPAPEIAESEPAAPEYTDQKPALPMKWHKFLVFFLLWAETIGSFIGGLAIALVALLQNSDTGYLSVKVITVLYGAALIGCAVIGGLALYGLLGMKSKGPRLYMIFLYAFSAATVIYETLGTIILHLPLFHLDVSSYVTSNGGEGVSVSISSPVITFVMAALFVLLNCVYYRKRKHMFTK